MTRARSTGHSHLRILKQRLVTTGDLAHYLGVSREWILELIARLGIEPIRDSSGRRLLTRLQVRRVIESRRDR